MKYICIIPARMNSSRLPNKVIREINGKTLLEHVVDNARRANIENVAVACDSLEVMEIAKRIGVNSIYTDPNLPTGTDRVSAAAAQLNDKYDIIVNMQGDLALFDASKLNDAVKLLEEHDDYDMATLAVPIQKSSMITSPNTVKIAIAFKDEDWGDALYFSRSPIPYESKQYYQHIGVYAFKRDAIVKFSVMPQTLLEKTERLEQLRALENRMRIGVKIVDHFDVQEINSIEDVKEFEEYLKNHEK